MSHSPTPEQQAIIEAAKTSKRSLLVEALAGAAKTTTLEMICKSISGVPILSLAFNKRIQLELEKRLPSHTVCKTLNGLGHGIWAQATGKRLNLQSNKVRDFLKEELDALSRDKKTRAYDDYQDINQSIRNVRNAGWVPSGTFPTGKSLIDDTTAQSIIEDTFNDRRAAEAYSPMVRRIVIRIIRTAFEGLIDFDDQIFMPAIFGGPFPKFPLNLVDEAQDLSPLNHAMLSRLVQPNARLIAVGDPYQSIYAFRGAVSNGMSVLRDTFDMETYGLSVSFRCPRAVVELARTRVPHMAYPDWAEKGSVTHHAQWSLDDIPDGAAIICRHNAPLFSLGFALIRSGRGVKLDGSDIGPGLVRTLKKLGEPSITREAAHRSLANWRDEALKKAKNVNTVYEKYECLSIFLDQGDSLSAATAYAEHLFASEGPVRLLSGHKSKGLEWDRVFVLDEWRIRLDTAEGEELEQERNIQYVIITRAKKELHFIDMKGLVNE